MTILTYLSYMNLFLVLHCHDSHFVFNGELHLSLLLCVTLASLTVTIYFDDTLAILSYVF